MTSCSCFSGYFVTNKSININNVDDYLLVVDRLSLLAICKVTRPDLIVLNIDIASRCDNPCTDKPLMDRISSPEIRKCLVFFQITAVKRTVRLTEAAASDSTKTECLLVCLGY